jgi:CspA family cold shock protein
VKETGVVKWFDPDKGYGFIRRKTGEEIFVHRSGLKPLGGALDAGCEVEFDVQPGPKGLQARDVSPVRKPTEVVPVPKPPALVPARTPAVVPVTKPYGGHPIFPDQPEPTPDARLVSTEHKATVGPRRRKRTEEFIPDFTIIFDSELSDDEVKAVFEALADYYRACGGLGLKAKFDLQKAEVTEPVHA